MRRIVDPNVFTVEAAHIDWLLELRKRRRLHERRSQPTEKRSRYSTALRWHVAAHRGNPGGDDGRDQGIGLPTGPFVVWRRPSVSEFEEHEVAWSRRSFFGVAETAVLEERLAYARVEVTSVHEGTIFGLADAAQPLSIVAEARLPGGTSSVQLHGSGITGLLFPSTLTIQSIVGVNVDAYHEVGDWEQVEIVGLPLPDDGSWSGVGEHDQPMGLVTELDHPRPAAIARLQRGAPPFGWDPEVASGVAAPPWQAPDLDLLVDELQAELLRHLREALIRTQVEQLLQKIDVPVPPPATLGGEQMPAAPTSAEVAPVTVVQLGVSTDPYLSLALGFGTNVEEFPDNDERTGRVKPFHAGSRWDYMITAPYQDGLDGRGDEPVELVAYALRPLPVTVPPLPVSLVAEHRGYESPPKIDQAWAASTTVSWKRPTKQTTRFRVASYAAARHAPGAPEAEALMERRDAGDLRPIAPATSQVEKDTNETAYLSDNHLVIANDPGHRAVRYSVATQNLFGLWSPWLGADHVVAQPAPMPPRIVALRVDAELPASGTVCDAVATVDLTWDWTDRRPHEVVLLGRLFPAADRSAPAPSPAPAGFDRTLAGGQAAVVLRFGGADVATVDGAVSPHLEYLSWNGNEFVAAGPAQSDKVRRYRLTVPNLQLDFAAAPHIGLALWVHGQEHLAPGHATAVTGPHVAFASDPIPRKVQPPVVPLGSMPDAEGRSHGRISWPPVAGAAGYHVYTSDEFTLLDHYDEPEPAPAATLSDRLLVLQNLFGPDPARRPFTRLTSRALTGTSLDVALPKGSRGIHVYVVITVGAGAVEGPWPDPVPLGGSAPTPFRALAAPRLATPPPPELFVSADAAGSATVTVTARPGHGVDHFDLHRVRVGEAARSFETMGPPIAVVPGAGGSGWTRSTREDGRLVWSGADSVTPSWKRVWYRTVGWGQPDGARGLVSGRSEPSNPFSVVVPPANPPELSAVSASPWTGPGAGAQDVLLSFTSPAPWRRTDLGPHRLEVRLADPTVPPAPDVNPLVDLVGDLGGLPSAPPASGSGWWREPDTSPAAYRVLVRRTSAVALVGHVRLVDPLGRVTQQSVSVPAESLLPEPEVADVQVLKLSGRGTVVSFTSASPLDYVLRITARPTRTLPIPRPKPIPFPFPLPRPPRFGRPLVVESPLGDLPVITTFPPGGGDLVVGRQKGIGRRRSYGALARVPVAVFEIRLTAPDGRSSVVTREVS